MVFFSTTFSKGMYVYLGGRGRRKIQAEGVERNGGLEDYCMGVKVVLCSDFMKIMETLNCLEAYVNLIY